MALFEKCLTSHDTTLLGSAFDSIRDLARFGRSTSGPTHNHGGKDRMIGKIRRADGTFCVTMAGFWAPNVFGGQLPRFAATNGTPRCFSPQRGRPQRVSLQNAEKPVEIRSNSLRFGTSPVSRMLHCVTRHVADNSSFHSPRCGHTQSAGLRIGTTFTT